MHIIELQEVQANPFRQINCDGFMPCGERALSINEAKKPVAQARCRGASNCATVAKKKMPRSFPIGPAMRSTLQSKRGPGHPLRKSAIVFEHLSIPLILPLGRILSHAVRHMGRHRCLQIHKTPSRRPVLAASPIENNPPFASATVAPEQNEPTMVADGG